MSSHRVSEGLRSRLFADVLFRNSPIRTLAVTGSAGKSTTTHLTSMMLTCAEIAQYVASDQVAQNPYPNYELLDRLDDMRDEAFLVAELTSGHLEYMATSPDIAVITTLSPDHGGWHGSIESYFKAKENILRFQRANQWAVINQDERLTMRQLGRRCRGQVAHFSATSEVEIGAFVREGVIFGRWEGATFPILPVIELADRNGYLENVLAASAAALVAGASPSSIAAALRDFRGLRYRLELVGEVGGVPVYNDGGAMTPRKAAAGLRQFPDSSITLIMGGKTHVPGEQLHENELERAMLRSACFMAARKAKRIIVLDEGGETLYSELLRCGFPSHSVSHATSIEEVVGEVVRARDPGNAIVFSPVFYVPFDEGRGRRLTDAIVTSMGSAPT
jgi:UDP-N-acetylmuramoylalanine-D-glutamate ligase